MVIVNTEDRLFTPSAGEDQYASEIPVIMIRATDEEALLSSGNSALLVHIGDKEASDRAAWETAVTEHVAQRATPALREVCSQAHAPLHALLEAAGAVGMERDEELSALRFLHETGSVLHYSESTRRGSAELAQTVFMQPQWIIDGIKYCLLYTSPSPRDKRQSRMPSSA